MCHRMKKPTVTTGSLMVPFEPNLNSRCTAFFDEPCILSMLLCTQINAYYQRRGRINQIKKRTVNHGLNSMLLLLEYPQSISLALIGSQSRMHPLIFERYLPFSSIKSPGFTLCLVWWRGRGTHVLCQEILFVN